MPRAKGMMTKNLSDGIILTHLPWLEQFAQRISFANFLKRVSRAQLYLATMALYTISDGAA